MREYNILTLGNPAWDFNKQLDDIRGGTYYGFFTNFLLPGAHSGVPENYESVLEDIAIVAGAKTAEVLGEGNGNIDKKLSEGRKPHQIEQGDIWMQ